MDNENSKTEDNEEKMGVNTSGPDECNALNNKTLKSEANENISLPKDSKSDTTLVSADLHIQTKNYNESNETQDKELHDQTGKMEQVNNNSNNIPLTNSSVTCPQEIACNSDNVLPQVIEREKSHDSSDQISVDVKDKLQITTGENFESEGKDKGKESSKFRIGEGGEQSQVHHLERSKQESRVDSANMAKGLKNSKNVIIKHLPASSCPIDKSKICLRFHIIMPSDEVHKCGKVSLKGQYFFKKFAEDVVMNHKRNIFDGVDILHCEVDLPKEHVSGKTISYAYSTTKEQINVKLQMNLDFLKNFQDLYEWNIYDAYLPGEPSKSFMARFASAFTKLVSGNKDVNHNILLAWYFELLPKKFSDSPGSGKKFIFEFLSVFKSAERSLKNFKIPEDCLNKMVSEFLKEFLTNKLDKEHLSRAACVLLIFKECKFFDDEISHQLCCLLSLRPDDNKKCEVYEYFCKLFPEHWKRDIADALLNFLKKIVNTKSIDPDWIIALPFLHFLEGKSKPFQELYKNADHENEEWWGVSGISDLKDVFKRKMSENMPLDGYVRSLPPMFEVDHLLPRSFLAMMSLHHIPQLIRSKKFPLDACLANVTFFIKTNNSKYYQNHLFGCLNELKSLMDDVLKDQQKFNDAEGMQYILNLTFSLFKNAMDSYLSDNIKLLSTSIMISALCVAFNLVEKMSVKNDDYSKELDQFVGGVTLMIRRKWLFYPSFEYQIFSGLLELSTTSTSFDCRWKCFIKDISMNKFEKMKFCDKCKIFSVIMAESCHSCLKDWIFDVMLKEVENGLKRQTGDLHIMFEHDNMHTFKKIFDVIVEKIWPLIDDNFSMLMFALDQPLFVKLVKVYRMENLGEESGMKLAQAMSILEEIQKSLFTGDIEIGLVHVLSNNSDKFLRLLNCICNLEKKEQKQREDEINELLKQSKHDLQFYHQRCHQIRVFLDFCHGFDTNELNAFKQEILLKDSDLNLSKISKLSAAVGDRPTLKILQIVSGAVEMLKFLNEHQQSITLKDLWDNCLRKSSLKSTATITDIVDSIYLPCKKLWEKISKALKDRSIQLSDVQKMFLHFNDDDLLKELNMLCKDDDETKHLHDQIKNYQKLCECKKGAETMLEFKSKFGLSGSFDDAEKIADVVKRESLSLGDISKELIEECKALHDFSDIQRRCLEVFIEEKQFVEWLRNSLSGPREIKVLVDLALISAEGQGDMEVEKASCLHAAATAYSSLIYDLKTEMGFTEFISLCKTVWSVAGVDKKIAEKFRDAARHLEWFVGIKKSHGAVEVNALENATIINSKGIFVVGNLSSKDTNALTLEDVVQMKLYLKKGERYTAEHSMENVDSETWKVHDIKHLCDLQSKLMLVAGKAQEGKQDVEVFNRTLDGVMRLANVYMKLVDRGCCMFTSWKVTFFCNQTKQYFARIDFSSNDEHVQHILGTHRESKKLKIYERIEKLCDVMEDCLKEWNQYVQEKRLQKHYLNFFTTKQLIILQQEIAKALKDEDAHIGRELSLLLSLVKPSSTKKDLFLAAKSALEQLSKSNGDELGDISANKSSEVDEDDSLSEFVKELLKAGFSLPLAKAAEERLDAENLQEAILWCMENENNLEEDEMQENDKQPTHLAFQAEKINFYGFLQEEMTNISKKLPSENSLEGNFLEIWKTFLEKVDSGFADYISVELLGLILEKIGSEFGTRFNSARALPCQMREGRPNLVLSDQSQMWNTILSIYGNSFELPLPNTDEVLICNQNTSTEEIEIMCMRAKADKCGKLYCLAGAEMLDYNVAVSIEKSLSLIQEDTKFIIVCDCNVRSHVADAFDQFKVKFAPLDLEDIKKYVLRHLTHRGSFSNPEISCAKLIKSDKAGTGKTLKVRRTLEEFVCTSAGNAAFLSIPLQNKSVDVSAVVKRLRKFAMENEDACERVVHFDVSSEVVEGVDCFLFNLLILGTLSDEDGYVWRKLPGDVYLVESCPIIRKTNVRSNQSAMGSHSYLHKMFYLLPTFNCWSPNDSLRMMKNKDEQLRSFPSLASQSLDQKLDEKEFKSEHFQRVCMYLSHQLNQPNAYPNMIGCTELLLRFCGVEDPSWAELKHFIDFFNNQLVAYENSVFCQRFMVGDLPDFGKFVIDFMLLMSQDFATRSLKISEESPEMLNDINESLSETVLLEGYEMKRTWEMSSHPYLFFNNDGHSFTFIGFVVDRATGNIVNPANNGILRRAAVRQPLFDALQRNGVNLSENFDMLTRMEKLIKMATIIGLEEIHDPDETYELTADNVKKMLAIYMRFRCNIPVVVMGETGCGKTRLIKFLCDFMKPPFSEIKNMSLMKIHGGTTMQNIVDKIKRVSALARENSEKIPGIKTVLFFDEANTTSAVGLIKEAMCDQTVRGESLEGVDLKLVAACNPYRRHSDALIGKLEKAGLGYHVGSSKTTDRLGTIPMRHLVYRVRSLPPSMLPLVWDFGHLDEDAEKLYIRQMVHCCISKELNIKSSETLILRISDILSASQSFMRDQKDESSFVSLRDVERCLKVMVWFYQHDSIFAKMDEIFAEKSSDDRVVDDDVEQFGDDDDENNDGEDDDDDGDGDDDGDIEDQGDAGSENNEIDDLSRSLILALGVCYHACLSKREEYRSFISPHFESICTLKNGPDTILDEISVCQDVFLKEVDLDENIARNQALKENLFVMVVCIELRIPLFLIGKPGSSKSLAKTVVADAMQGNQSKSELFRSFKSAHMVSYQCSPLSTPEGITGTFKQCAKLQEGKDLNKFVSVVVLDEVGLAEDSEKMPLKALHPLLEDGCEDEDEILPHKKVAFIGISNWSLDPAKMNRGIFVQRCSPDENELILSARGICSSDATILRHCGKLFGPLARGYLKLCESTMEIKEFFGLRDFYSLIKMIYAASKRIRMTPSWTDLRRAILRNFSGLERVKALELFKEYVKEVVHIPEDTSLDHNYIPASLIRESLGETNLDFENRYLLILMDNYSSFNLLQHDLLQMKDARIIFGSSFPKDLEYTQICRNINRIKIYMETGKTVVLLNLENLYESLYDALNQYYVTFGDQRFVDLGLGTQRVKCKVHKSFKLIVVADKQVVYKRFPIPLINRLEKHYLSIDSLLTPEQVDITMDLQKWAEEFTKGRIDNFSRRNALTLADVFIGFHPNALASLVLQAFSKFQKDGTSCKDEILEYCQDLLLQCAVPESVLSKEIDGKDIYQMYFEKQQHYSLENFIKTHVVEKNGPDNVFVQITTHSRLLSKVEVNEMAKRLGLLSESIELLSLQAFGTEQQFSGAIKSFFESLVHCTKILILQCDSGDQYEDLIACTRFNVMNDYSNWDVPLDIKRLKHVLLIIQLPKVIGGCFVGFQGGKWLSYHIDNLHQDSTFMSLLPQMKDKSVSSLFSINAHFQQSESQKEFEQEEAKNRILENCIHAAAALLKSPVSYDAFRSRKAKSLEALIQNLHAKDADNVMFLDVLRMRVSQLLLEREESVTTEPESWLKREAASPENVRNAGSFSNSVVQYLETKVTPILAYIISYIDSNCNLDLLNTADEWIINLWFGMFRNANITFMKYNEIKAIKDTREMLEFDMRTYRKDGLLMRGRLPFSWLIKENVDKLVSQQHPQSEWLSKTFDVEETFNSSDIGKLLQAFSQDVEHKQMILDMYLFDYIQMTYKPASDSDREFEMVANDVKHNILLPLMMINNSSTDPTNLMSFSGIHRTYNEHCIKYKLFSEIVSCCPRIVGDISDQEKSSLKSMTILQKCLIYVLEMLTFSKEELKSIKQWANKVKGLTFLVNQLFCQIRSEDLKIDLQSMTCSWSRISTLKLFVEHTSSKQLLDNDIYYKIWTYMGERFDFKTLKCFENIDKFLKMCQKKGIEKCFGSILPSKCLSCGKDNGIINLLCDHRFCTECFDEIETFHRNKCPRCHRTAECASDSKGVKKESVEKYLVFKRQLNSFFMTLVSKMCFDGEKPPEEIIVEKLLDDVVFESELDKHMRTRNLLCGHNDPSPVIRSFLLQLLLKHSMPSVQKYLERFFKDQLVLCQDEPQIMELGILCLNCFEDHYKNLATKNSGTTERLHFVKDLWKENQTISLVHASRAMDVKTLQNVALLRFGLTVLAEGLEEHYLKNNLDENGYCAMRSLGDLASVIFEKNDQARYFLMKEIAHKFSFQNLLLFADNPSCRWFISPPDIKTEKQDSSLDHFLLCGQNYKTVRDSLFRAFYEKNPILLDKADNLTDYTLMLALFQQMMHSSTSEMVDVQDVDIWSDYLSGNSMLKSKDLAMEILKHELSIVNANLNPTHAEINLQALVFHFMVATKLMPSKNSIIQLLCLPMSKPESLKETYLPTMPQDDRFEVLELLLKREAIKFYACPNNHPYTIGECGMPNSRSRCLTCGEEIGGLNHNLAQGNKSLALTNENTQPGHILGQPGIIKTPSGERQMTPLQVSITRLFLHASLYIGSFSSVFPTDFIKPPIVPQAVHDFFMNHLKHDLEMVQRASGQNEDNVLIVLHTIIHTIYEKKSPNKSLNLITKDGRLEWENEFVKEYIRPHIDKMDEIIDKGRKVMLKDDGLVLSPLMKEIYEIVKDSNPPDSLENIHQCPIFWKYRPTISKEHLIVNLQNLSEINGKVEDGEQKHSLLQYFLENGHVLQEIRKLPAILDLHDRLCVALNRRISIYEADKCTASEFLKDQDEMTRASLKELFKEFFSVWNVLRFNLKEFPFQQKVVPEEYLKEHLSFDSKIGYFLPTMQGLGVCSVALIYFLADQQNQLLTIYHKTTRKGMTRVVSLRECTSAHLIQFDPEKELHTLILAHCNYSLEPGKSTKLEYDYVNLEIQIMDHFIHDKPMIKPNIKFMNYKEDFNVCVVLSEIENKIAQVPVLPECLETNFKILPDVAKVLPCFNVVLEFIAAIGNNEDENIVEFMTKTLKMKNVFADYPTLSNLQFKHAKQVWISLSFIQAKMQVKNGQLPFWSVDNKYKKILPDEIIQKLMNCLQYTRRELFSLLLYECIVLNITVSGGGDDLDNSDQSLKDILLEFINSKGQEGSLGVLESGTFPKEILARHCIDAWLCSVDPEKRLLLK